MLTTELLIHRYNGEELVPTRLKLDQKTLALAADTIDIFGLYVGKKRLELDEELAVLEGAETDYRVKRGLAHLLLAFCTFETISPLEPPALRERVFALSATRVPSPQNAAEVIREVAEALTHELGREVTTEHVKEGLYADLADNQVLTSFEPPTAEALLARVHAENSDGGGGESQGLLVELEPGRGKLLASGGSGVQVAARCST